MLKHVSLSDYFCVAVAGYPEVHLDSWNSDHLPPSEQSRVRDLKYLKEKVDAGADFVMTQFCFEDSIFERFVSECRRHRIDVPIIPAVRWLIPWEPRALKICCHLHILVFADTGIPLIQEVDNLVQVGCACRGGQAP